ncbi:MAG: hypothetical protein ACXWUG_18035 [Polyangiales bacterium]
MRALVFSVFLLGCADVAKWSTPPGESYCGVVTTATFVRAGMDEGTKLRLELDAEHLQSSPGRIWSTPFQSGERFDGLELRVIPQLLHDPLSTLTFGEGRVKSAILVGDLRSADGKSTSEVMIFLSLMQSGNVEIRIVRGASAGSAQPGTTAPPQLFGVFALEKAQGTCDVN